MEPMRPILLSKTNYPCEDPQFVYGTCETGHISSKVMVRCRKCSKCLLFRKKRFISHAYERFDHATRVNKLMRRRVVSMWTFGTNLKDTSFENYNKKTIFPNRNRIVGWFQSFKKRVRQHYVRSKKRHQFEFLTWVLETGKNGYLHLHVLTSGFISHSYLRTIWSKVSHISNPNVNFMSSKISSKGFFISYLSKYMAKVKQTYVSNSEEKDLIKYQWNGQMVCRQKCNKQGCICNLEARKLSDCYICKTQIVSWCRDWKLHNVNFMYFRNIDDWFEK